MTLITGDARMRVMAPRLVAVLAAVVAIGGCSAAAVPAATTSAALPTASPVAAAAATPSAPRSPAPSAIAAIVKITPIPGAPDSGTVLQLAVTPLKNIGTTLTLWDRITLTAPAGKAWHIKIDDQDQKIDHNFTVASGPTFPERIFQTPNFSAGIHTFDIPALPAGRYLFICTLTGHADVMTGVLTLQ